MEGKAGNRRLVIARRTLTMVRKTVIEIPKRMTNDVRLLKVENGVQ